MAVTLGGAAALQRTSTFATTDQLTMMCWANPASTPGAGSFANVIGAVPFAAPVGLTVEIHGTVWAIGEAAADVDSAITAVVGRWDHLALVVHKNLDKKLFINGQLRASVNDTATPNTTFEIGDDASTSFFNGRIAAVKVWKRPLSQVEIQREMLQNEPDNWHLLVGWWPFDTYPGAALVNDSNLGAGLTVRTGTPTASASPAIPYRTRRWRNILDVPQAAGGGGGSPWVTSTLMGLMGVGR
jgi:hypothetical protein